LRAITVVFVFSRASALSERTSSFVHGRSFVIFFAIISPRSRLASESITIVQQESSGVAQHSMIFLFVSTRKSFPVRCNIVQRPHPCTKSRDKSRDDGIDGSTGPESALGQTPARLKHIAKKAKHAWLTCAGCGSLAFVNSFVVSTAFTGVCIVVTSIKEQPLPQLRLSQWLAHIRPLPLEEVLCLFFFGIFRTSFFLVSAISSSRPRAISISI
jgi:hypothetical protein